MGPEYPLRARFARLTAQKDRCGLYSRPEVIGTREGWADALALANLEQRGHRLVRRPARSIR